NSAFTYKDAAVDVKRVGRELGVRYVLEGSVRRSGQRVRVSAQLIDATTAAHIWADRYDGEFSDIFAVQDAIASAVASIMEPTLAEAEQHRVARRPPESLDAWEACQRGYWHLYRFTAEENDVARTFFRKAVDLDRGFASAHCGLVLAIFWDFWLYSRRSMAEAASEALGVARTAVQAGEGDAMADALLGVVASGSRGVSSGLRSGSRA